MGLDQAKHLLVILYILRAKTRVVFTSEKKDMITHPAKESPDHMLEKI